MKAITQASIPELHGKVLEIFKIFQNICQRHKLRYYASGGTLIGALLYKGFIPFDDDMDINMPRPDYEKFKRIAPKELPEYLKIYNGLSSKHADYHFIKLHDTRTMYTSNLLQDFPDTYTGVFIDIEPIDGAPNEQNEREAWYFKLEQLYCFDLLRKFGKSYLYPDTIAWLYPNRIKRAIAYAWIQLHSRTYYAKKYSKLQKQINKQYPFDTATYVSWPRYGMFRSKNFWNTRANDWSSHIEVPFEDTTIHIPIGYENILTSQYCFMPTIETQRKYEQEADSHHVIQGIADINHSIYEYQQLQK
ncbi:MAG: LicD family protein [Bifidobacteriaceae bacterium]|nr:LicD family protein [Bifidobacteriaceae bacterium]